MTKMKEYIPQATLFAEEQEESLTTLLELHERTTDEAYLIEGYHDIVYVRDYNDGNWSWSDASVNTSLSGCELLSEKEKAAIADILSSLDENKDRWIDITLTPETVEILFKYVYDNKGNTALMSIVNHAYATT